MSSLDRVKYFANTNQITEAEKIERLCDIIIARDFSGEKCLNSVISEIAAYANNTANRMSEELSTKTAQVLAVPTVNDFPNYVENSFFRIHYENTMSITVANAIANAFLAYKNHLNSLGFVDALPDSNFNSDPNNIKYNVYVTASSHSDPNTTGTATPISIVENRKCTSHIYLYNVTSIINEDVKDAIAHEYFHAVQFAYNASYPDNISRWFSEACATWYSTYMGNGENISNNISSYFALGFNARKLISNDYMYAKALFPLAIDIAYGGPETIRLINVYFSTINNNIDFATIKNAVNYAIQANNRTGTFDDVFKTFAIYCTAPNYYYQSRIPLIDEEEELYYEWNNTSFVSSSYSSSLCEEYGIVFTKLSPPSTVQTYSVSGTITFEEAVSGSSVYLAKVRENSVGACTSSFVSLYNSTFSINETSLGSNQAKVVYYAVINIGENNRTTISSTTTLN